MTNRNPRLRIKIVKRLNKLPLLICTRADGSQTMAELNVGAEHDLSHYAVETTLGFRRAFFGLLTEGMSVEDFNVPAGTTKLDLPPEANATEFIVGLLEMEIASGQQFADFNAELQRAMSNTRKPETAPTISDVDIATMRRRIVELKTQWRNLPAGESIELEFY